ncbi:MAG: hypothetical protein AAB400_00575 [Patescibacteria group bacterium]
MKTKASQQKLFCFNPFVTFFTGALELFFAVVACIKYSKTPFGRIAAIALILLSVFQFAEYTICSSGNSVVWNKIAYAAITLLPAIGIHLISYTTHPTYWIRIAYPIAIIIATSIAIVPGAFTATYCTGRFVVFQLNDPLRIALGSYYTFFILLGIFQLTRALIKKVGDREINLWLLLGYLSFTIPALIVYIITFSSRIAVPSIMCGFAVLLAGIIVFKILPLYHKSIS